MPIRRAFILAAVVVAAVNGSAATRTHGGAEQARVEDSGLFQNYPREVIKVGDPEPVAEVTAAEAAPVKLGTGGVTMVLVADDSAPKSRGPQGLMAVAVVEDSAQGMVERRPPNVIKLQVKDGAGMHPGTTDATNHMETGK